MAAQLQAFIRSMSFELRTPHRQCCVCGRDLRVYPYPRVRVGSGICLTGRFGYGYDVHGYGYTRFYPHGTRFFTILERR